jgi:hypothetical protein
MHFHTSNRQTKMALSRKNSEPFTPPGQVIWSYDTPHAQKDGKVILHMEPFFPNSVKKTSEEDLKKPTWTRPVDYKQMVVVMPEDDGKHPLNGNLEYPDFNVDNVFKKMEETYPGTSEIVKQTINCKGLEMSKANAVLVLHYFNRLKKKGAFEGTLTFEQIIATCKLSFNFLEDWAPEQKTYERILEKAGPEKKLKDVEEIFSKFLQALGYNLFVSTGTFNSILKECNE